MPRSPQDSSRVPGNSGRVLAPRLWWRLSSGELEAIVASITFNIKNVEDHPVIEVAAALHGLMASSSILQPKALAIGVPAEQHDLVASTAMQTHGQSVAATIIGTQLLLTPTMAPKQR
ncbi:unnamed protein product [Prunus armeniaca]